MGEEYRFCEEFGLREVGVEAEEQYGKIRGILHKSAIRKEYEDFLRHKDEFVCRKYSNIPKNGHVLPWGALLSQPDYWEIYYQCLSRSRNSSEKDQSGAYCLSFRR